MTNLPLSPELCARLDAVASSFDLGPDAEEWFKQATACVRLDLGPAEMVHEVGQSRYGGLPDLPADAGWPLSAEGEGLVFLQQINLATIPPYPGSLLPPDGLLSLFLESDAMAGPGSGPYQVHYTAAGTPLRAGSIPAERVHAFKDYEHLKPHALEPRWSVDLPSDGAPFDALCERSLTMAFDVLRQAFRDGDVESVGGRLLGHPYGVQNDQIKCAIRLRRGQSPYHQGFGTPPPDPELEAERLRWVPLWQLCSNAHVGVCYWDAGDLDIYLPKDELAALDFSNAYVELETS